MFQILKFCSSVHIHFEEENTYVDQKICIIKQIWREFSFYLVDSQPKYSKFETLCENVFSQNWGTRRDLKRISRYCLDGESCRHAPLKISYLRKQTLWQENRLEVNFAQVFYKKVTRTHYRNSFSDGNMLGAVAANEPRIYGLVLLVFGRQGRPGDFGVLPFFVRKVIVLNIYGKNSIQCRVGGLLITDKLITYKLITDKLITKIYQLINYKLIT